MLFHERLDLKMSAMWILLILLTKLTDLINGQLLSVKFCSDIQHWFHLERFWLKPFC